MIYASVIPLIGKTPLVKLNNFCKNNAIRANIAAKLEYFNPSGSVKDRAAKYMIEAAERSGKLKKGGIIVEPTSGNTGIAIAAIGAAKGYGVILTMPESMSVERRNFLKIYGAELVLTDKSAGMRGAIEKAREISRNSGAIMLGQFENPANPEAHFFTTGPEIWEDTQGKIDIFVAGVGTGGTITGAGNYLKSKNPAVKVAAVEPFSSPVLSGGKSGAHKIQGIGAGFMPAALDTGVYDEVIKVTDEEAFSAARRIAREEGLSAGISSGAALCAAALIGKREENAGKNIVVVFPDSADRYLSLL